MAKGTPKVQKTEKTNENQTDSRSENVPKITAKIDRTFDGGNTKAIASATIGGAFAIHNIRVVNSERGLFVAMPASSYTRNGEAHYSDIFQPITATARTELNSAVLAAYEARLSMDDQGDKAQTRHNVEADEEDMDEDHGLSQNM